MKSGNDWGRLDLNFKNLSEISDYVNERVKVEDLTIENYISTENMLPNKGGIDVATKLPSAKTTSLYSKGDILLSNIRTYFKKIWYAEKDGGCSNDVLVVRARGEIEPKFLYYVLSNDKFFEYSSATSKGTKMPRGDKSAIMQYQIPDMPLEEQQTIVSVLSALDDRIAENKKINHHLEQIVYCNFNNFLDSSVKLTTTLYSLADVIDNRGKTPPLVEKSIYPIIDVRTLIGDTRLVEYKNAQKYVDEETYNNWFRSGHPKRFDSLISTVGSVGSIKMFLENKGTIAQNVVALRPKNTIGLFLYQLLLSIQGKLKAYDIGSVQPSIKVTHFMKQEVEIPDLKSITDWEKSIMPVVLLIENNSKEADQLIELRDNLLSKLMSGDISVID
ncbi:restriction endonuclease subunit S (plasmid) [Lactococcus lactis subsp. lactis]|uniref:restriction endonuclease subunit S n=1 Tax=Lactococcus lactis TaxID=1358 RepID=UPI0031200FBB